MAAIATIVKAWQDATSAYLAVNVTEAGGAVEYIGSVPKDAAWQTMTVAQQKATLVAAVKAVRDAQQVAMNALPGLSGTVTV